MAFDYINEAFKKLDLLEEQMFDTSLNGINELSDFLDNDNTEEIIRVIDPEADTLEDVQESYVGKVIINCNICHSHIFENKEDIKIEEDGAVNIEDQCPYCGETEGFTIVGEIAPFAETKVEVDGEEVPVDNVDNDINEGLFSKKSKPTHALIVKYDEPEDGFEWYSFGVSSDTAALKRKESELHKEWSKHGSDTATKIVDISTAKKLAGKINMADTIEESLFKKPKSTPTHALIAKYDEPENGFEWYSIGVSSDIASLKRKESDLRKVWVRDEGSATDTKIVDIATAKKLVGDIDMADTIEEGFSKHIFSRATRRMSEDFKEVSVTTGDQHMEMSSDENGKISITSEPVSESGIATDDVIAPLSAETQDEILSNNSVEDEPDEDETFTFDETDIVEPDDSTEEETLEPETSEEETIVEESLDTSVDVDFDEVDDKRINTICENYLKRVYENVNAFKTTAVSSNDRKLIIEGIIRFDSGSTKKTGFIFEAHDIDRNNRVRFVGYNKHFTESKDAFSMVGVVDNKKLFVESLKYNYKVNNTPVRGVARRK